MLVLKSRAGLHTTINFSFFSVIGWDLDLDHRDIEWFALEMNRDHSVIFEIASKYYIWRKGNSMNSMKRQNDRILKEELLRSVSAQYATGDQ